MEENIRIVRKTFGALAGIVLLAACLANYVYAASAATKPRAAEPKPATASAVKGSVARLTAPADLAASESLQNGEGPIEGVVCVAGLEYRKEMQREKGRFRDGFTVLSTNAAYLKLQGVHEKFDGVLRSGAVPNSELVDPLYCQEAAFDLIRNMGTLQLPPFDAASWFVGDFGQDECGDTKVLVLARRGTSRYFVTIAIEKLNPPSFTCLRPVEIKEGWCERRTRCIHDYLGTKANQGVLMKELAEITRGLSFSR